jgi:hypothetical protein
MESYIMKDAYFISFVMHEMNNWLIFNSYHERNIA